jgi:hypothetical protein
MPISEEEFEAGTVEVSGDEPIANDEEGPIETEKDLITAFLSERPDKAFTEREIVLGLILAPRSWIGRGIHSGRSLTV